jgi:hypothetical protein
MSAKHLLVAAMVRLIRGTTGDSPDPAEVFHAQQG